MCGELALLMQIRHYLYAKNHCCIRNRTYIVLKSIKKLIAKVGRWHYMIKARRENFNVLINPNHGGNSIG